MSDTSHLLSEQSIRSVGSLAQGNRQPANPQDCCRPETNNTMDDVVARSPKLSWLTMSDDQTTWLTPGALKKLQAEFEYMTTTGRREITERIAEARSHGDLKENADYDAAKNEQGMQEAKIRNMRHILDHAVVREATDDGTVQIGSVVTVRDDNGDEDEYFVAVPENKVPGFLLASPLGPLGAALVGAAVGDDVSYEAPAGTFTVTVIAIRPFES